MLPVCELFGETIRNVVAILLLNIMELFGVGALLDRPCHGLPNNVCVVPVIPVCI